MQNLDLELFKCDYLTKKEIVKRLNSEDLETIYSISKYNFLNNEEAGFNARKINGSNNKNLTFNKLKFQKAGKQVNLNRTTYDSLKEMKHMKSVLGHISVYEQDVINPVPIYCLTYSATDDLVFTGDNNG